MRTISERLRDEHICEGYLCGQNDLMTEAAAAIDTLRAQTIEECAQIAEGCRACRCLTACTICRAIARLIRSQATVPASPPTRV